MPTLWKARIKSPATPSKGVWDLIVETDEDDKAAALEVVKYLLNTKYSHPNTTPHPMFIEHFCDKTQREMRAELAAHGRPVEEKPGPDASVSAARGGTTIGAVNDPTSPVPHNPELDDMAGRRPPGGTMALRTGDAPTDAPTTTKAPPARAARPRVGQ